MFSLMFGGISRGPLPKSVSGACRRRGCAGCRAVSGERRDCERRHYPKGRGMPSTSPPSSTSWPFMWQGLEHEVTDPAHLYFESSGNVYNPDPFHLSLTGPQSSDGPGGGPGSIGGPGGGGGAGLPLAVQNQLNVAGTEYLVVSTVLWDSPGWVVAAGLQIFAGLFPDLFGGSDGPPPIPYQLKHGRHPIYSQLGISLDLIVSQGRIRSGGGNSSSVSRPAARSDTPRNDPTTGGIVYVQYHSAPPGACGQYDAECGKSGGTDQYACKAGDCCRAFGNSSFANCTRGCLLGFESGVCFGNPNSTACRTEAHAACYAQCASSPGDFAEWLRYPACRGLLH